MVTATATNFLSFKGRSGRMYNVNAYISDVVGAAVPLNVNGAAGTASSTFWRPPEDVALVDAAFITGPTVAVGIIMQNDGAQVPGTPLLLAAFLNTLATRPAIGIAFRAGSLISAQQF